MRRARTDVKFPVGSSIGLIPPPGLELSGIAPGFHDADNKVSMLLLELPLAAYLQIEASMSTEAAKKRGIVVDHRETLFTDAGTAVLSAGDDANDKSRKWMMVALLPKVTALGVGADSGGGTQALSRRGDPQSARLTCRAPHTDRRAGQPGPLQA